MNLNNEELLKELEELIDKTRAIECEVFRLDNELDSLCDGLIDWKEKWYDNK